MSLRTKAVLVSMLPLVVIFLIAIPEAILQGQAIRTTVLAQRAAIIASAAGAIMGERVRSLLAARNLLDGRTHNIHEYDAADSRFQESAVRLASVVGVAPEFEANLLNISRDVIAMDHLLDGMAAAGIAGHRSEGLSIYTGPKYAATLSDLQRDVSAFALRAQLQQKAEAASMRGLWSNSLILFAGGLFGMVCATLLAFAQASRIGSAIHELVAKSERNRSDEPLGERSHRTDEIGLLDGALHDLVSAQQDRERQLRLYRLLADVSRDAILFVDRETLRIVDANPAALAIYGYERAQLIGLPTTRLHAADNPIDDTMIARCDTTDGLAYEGTHQRLDGTTFPVEVFARTAELQGRALIVKTVRDISERHRAAEQLSKALTQAVDASRLKSEFVATMSHEIRTPMHGVLGMSELLLERPLGPVEREYAATLKESAQALLAIINDVLDFSKLEANKIELEAVAFDPAQVVAAVVNLVRGAARNKGLALHSHASPHVPSEVRGDPTRLRQILINLVGNAVKFTTSGEVTVSTSVERNDRGSVVLAFAVSDTGIGVTPEARLHLFEAFTQGDSSTTRKFGGTGLGLSISRRLSELMGGRLWLGDHEGPGSTFCFTARFEHIAEESTHAIPAAEGKPVDPFDLDALNAIERGRKAGGAGSVDVPRRARILLAEDSALIRMVTSFQLQELHYGVDIVEDGKQAVAAAATGDYELVLMDMRMPEMDGLAATRAIRAAERETGCRVIIVALTANALDGDREACIESGMDDFLTKPMQLDALRTVLKRWLPERV